jgi:hypothetical protein
LVFTNIFINWSMIIAASDMLAAIII